MKFRSQKGYTGIDIAVSVVVITIFVSLIAVVIARFNSSANEIKNKEEAVAIAVKEIENIKSQGLEVFIDKGIDTEEIITEGATDTEGFYKVIIVEDYAHIEEGKLQNIVKKVTVKISYMFKGEEQTVELSTILSKEN